MPNIKQIKTPDNTTYDILDANAYHINDTEATDASKFDNNDYIPFYETKAADTIGPKKLKVSNLISRLKTLLGLGTASTKNSTTSVTQGSDDLVTSGAVWTAIDELPEPMVFRGSLGTGGTITSLPTNGTAAIGDTYKVIAKATYAGISAEVGDTFICVTKTSSANTWTLIPSGDEPSGTVTNVAIQNGNNGITVSGGPITDAGTLTVSHADTSSQSSSSNSGRTYIQSIDLDGYGHVTSLSTATETVTNTDTKVTQTNNTANSYLPILLANSTTSPETTTVKKNTNLTANPSNGYMDVNSLRIHSNVTDHSSNFGRLYCANTADRRYKLPVDKDNDSELAVVADIPTVNDATLTINQNGILKGTFTANQSGNGTTVNLTDTTYENKAAASGGTALSLVTTGDKYNWNNKATSSDITNAINSLDGGTIGTPSTSKTLTALSQTNGNISATFEDISIVKSQISNLGNPERTVRQTLSTTNANYPLLMSYSNNSTTTASVDNVTYRSNSIYANPSDKMITVDSAIYSRWIDALIKPTFWVKKPSSGTGANAGLALDTKGGRWGLFTYPSSDENLRFLYFTDAKIADPSTSDANSPNASFYINGANNTVYANIIDTKLQTTDITIASGDKLVVTDSSDSNKLRRTSLSFDGSTTTKALTQKGTWETFTNNTAASSAPPKVASSSSTGTSTNYARQDHTHGIDLATGDANGQVKIAGTNVDVKGLGSNAYTSTSYLPLAGGRLTGNLYNKSALGNVDATANDNGISDTVYSGTIEGQDKNNRRITRLETSAYANGDICFGMNIRQWYMDTSGSTPTAKQKATKGFKMTMDKAGTLNALLDGTSNADWFIGKNGLVVGNTSSNYVQLTLDSNVNNSVFLTTPSSNGKLSITNDLSSYNYDVGTCNLIRYPSQHTSKSQNGLIFLDNGDGSVTVTGTATANTTYYFAVRGNNIWQIILTAGSYKLIGCPSGGSSSTYSIYCNTYINGTTTSSSGIRDTGDGATVTYSSAVSMGCYIDIKKDTSFPTNGVVFRPQLIPLSIINLGSYNTGSLYAQTNRQLTITKADYSQIATYENTQNASRAYAKNELMIWRGALYRVTTAISSGSTISTSNVTATTLSAEIKTIRDALNI